MYRVIFASINKTVSVFIKTVSYYHIICEGWESWTVISYIIRYKSSTLHVLIYKYILSL